VSQLEPHSDPWEIVKQIAATTPLDNVCNKHDEPNQLPVLRFPNSDMYVKVHG
jgi:hypothetical protein